MFRKVFKGLVICVLGICSVHGMTAPDDRESNFLSNCHNLMVCWNTQLIPVNSGSGITVGIRNDFERRWQELDKELCDDIYSGCIFDHSQDKTREVDRVVSEKSQELLELKNRVRQFLVDLERELQKHKSVKEGKWFKRTLEKKEITDIASMQGVLGDLQRAVGEGIVFNIVKRHFNIAYDAHALEGSSTLQEWFLFYNSLNNFFSQYLLNEMNREALVLGTSMRSTRQVDGETGNRIAAWNTKFVAMRNLRIPRGGLDSFPSSTDDSMLTECLNGIQNSYKRSIIRLWRASISNRPRCRCRFFIPNVDEYSIEEFVANSGIAYYKKNVVNLLECGSVPALNEILWGSPLRSEATPKGILLNTLLMETNDGNSYLNNTLIITNLDSLISVRPEKRDHVETIWNFLKFITDDDISDGDYRFPYLGADNRDQMRRRLDLSKLNVILLTRDRNFGEIEAGLRTLGINSDLVGALGSRLTVIAAKE